MSEIKAKYEEREKYLLILHEAKCHNYFIVKCSLVTNCIELALYSLMVNWFKYAEAKTASADST